MQNNHSKLKDLINDFLMRTCIRDCMMQTYTEKFKTNVKLIQPFFDSNTYKKWFILVCIVSTTMNTVVADERINNTNTEKNPDTTDTENKFGPADGSTRSFAGLNFGVGITLTQDTGRNDRIVNASLDEVGIVRVDKDQNDVARVMLESHYFFHSEKDDTSFLYMVDGPNWGHGPFVALQPGTDEIIEAIGLGWMVGFKRGKNSNESWNLGIGYIVDPSVKILGDGITENQALPAGETQIRFKETSQRGVFLLVSFTF